MNPYDAYDPFARVYNQHWGFFATKAYPILEQLVLEKLPPGCAVTLFELDGSRWVRTDFPLIQRWYEEVEIKERLRKAGFEELQSFYGNEPMFEGSVHEGRMFFVGKKRDARQPHGRVRKTLT